MKKKFVEVKIVGYPGESKNPYKYTTLHFAWVALSKERRLQVSSITGCREVLSHYAFSSVAGNAEHKTLSVDFSKMRVLLVRDHSNVLEYKKRLFNGKAILNLLESINGWEKSVITTVSHPYYDDAWLLTGAKEWIAQPQALSLAMWIMRFTSENGPFNVNSVADLKKDLVKYKEKVEKHLVDIRNNDNGKYLRWFCERMFIFVENYNEIFKDIDFNKAWFDIPTFGVDFSEESGFMTFSEGAAGYSPAIKAAQKRFCALCDKYIK